MENRGKALGVIIAVVLVGVAVYGITMYQRFNRRGEEAERILSLENPLGGADSLGSGGTPETIEGLKHAIAVYEKEIERYIETAARTGTYWKILAVRLQDRGLHGEALQALEQAIFYSPEDAALHYSAGISAGIMAKSLHDVPGASGAEREQYYAAAERAFLRAIELDGRYLRPRYSLGVLYVFDLDRPGEAVPHLERCLEISRNDVDTMFVLARAFYMTEQYEDAVNLYDRIITLSADAQKRTDAQNNRQTVLERMDG